jgi:hypothetical protein
MIRWRTLCGAAVASVLICGSAYAHGLQPIQVQIKEREPGAFLVQWRTPKVLPAQAMPRPKLPESCRPEGERVLLDQPGGWLCRQVYRCPEGLAGRTIAIDSPFTNPTLTTVVRVELLSGERFAHALAPMEEFWQVPEADVGSFAAWLRSSRSTVLAGAGHILGHWVHLAFLLALLLLGGATGSVPLVTAFAVGQLLAVAVTAALGRTFDPAAAEISVAIAVAFLACEALRPAPAPRRLAGLAAAAGLLHGLALAALLPAAADRGGTAWSELLVLVLGMDAVMLVVALGVPMVTGFAAGRRSAERLRPVFTYAVGATAVAAALVLAFEPPSTVDAATISPRLPGMSGTSASGLPGSRRVAPQAGEAPIESYLAVEPFEVRNEVLIRVSEVAGAIDLAAGGDNFIPIDVQDGVARRIGALVASRTAVAIDGEPAEGIVDRVGFMSADATGVLPRQMPVREAIDDALVGVTIVYLTAGMPDAVTLAWKEFGAAVAAIPATVIDPESSVSTVLTAERPELRWENQLMENPVPTVAGVAVEPARLPVPWFSLALVGAATALLVGGSPRRRGSSSPSRSSPGRSPRSRSRCRHRLPDLPRPARRAASSPACCRMSIAPSSSVTRPPPTIVSPSP